jgi:hypothetical protein
VYYFIGKIKRLDPAIQNFFLNILSYSRKPMSSKHPSGAEFRKRRQLKEE